jgi:uncharacterized protein YndB with AHSA1/START domain
VTKIRTQIFIARPIAEVYEYLTTAANWAAWHPATLSVSGAVDHSAKTGEIIVEHIRAGSRQDRVTWKVTEKLAPFYWEFEGKGDHGGSAVIIYRLSERPEGTLFLRELHYQMPNLLLTLLDWVYVQFLMRKQSLAALHNVKRELENPVESPQGRSRCRGASGKVVATTGPSSA